MNPLISIVTLTHNKLAVTRRCLPTLLESSYRPWELIVVDNGSSDGTPDWLNGFAEQAARQSVAVQVIANPDNGGCSTARNQGATAARGEWLVFIDNDVALRRRAWLEGLLARLCATGAAMAGPKLVYPVPPHNIQCAGVAISRTGRPQFRGRGETRTTPAFNLETEVQCLISACCMVSREAFDKAGGFDEAFNPVEYEDFDLCYRIRESGARVLYVPSVEMYHCESVTTAGTPTLPNTYLIIKNGLLFKRRWRKMFERENGPPDEATRWKTIETGGLDQVREFPVVE